MRDIQWVPCSEVLTLSGSYFYSAVLGSVFGMVTPELSKMPSLPSGMFGAVAGETEVMKRDKRGRV